MDTVLPIQITCHTCLVEGRDRGRRHPQNTHTHAPEQIDYVKNTFLGLCYFLLLLFFYQYFIVVAFGCHVVFGHACRSFPFGLNSNSKARASAYEHRTYKTKEGGPSMLPQNEPNIIMLAQQSANIIPSYHIIFIITCTWCQ